jgi:Arc/MetJ-type ribon-helix-helix transcriptional regulator
MPPSEAQLPSSVREFLREQVRTYEELEVLVALHARPETWIERRVLLGELASAPDAVEAALEHWVQCRLVEERARPTPAVRYAPQHPLLATRVNELAEAYRSTPLAVMRELTQNALGRLRGQALRTFSDAFLLRPKRSKDG